MPWTNESERVTDRIGELAPDRLTLEREDAPEGERWWARRWLCLEALAEIRTDEHQMREAYRSWRTLVQALVAHPDLWFEFQIEKSGNRKAPRPFWLVALKDETSEKAQRRLRDLLPDCARAFTSAEPYFRFRGAAGHARRTFRLLRNMLELGRRLDVMPAPSGKTLLLPCPWVPREGPFAELLEALRLEPGHARLRAKLREVQPTREERAILGQGTMPPRPVGFLSETPTRKEPPLPHAPSLFEVHVELETDESPSLSCLHHIGAAITEPYRPAETHGREPSTGGFLWAPPRQLPAAMKQPRLYYLYTFDEAAAVFPPPLSCEERKPPYTKTRFLIRDTAPIETKGFSCLGLDAARPGKRVCVETERRREHMFLLGATGTGKSNLLGHLSLQGIRQGAATIVIDFHGDLCEAILARLGPLDDERLTYFNTADVDYPIGLNLLSANSDTRPWLAHDRAIQSLLALFEKQWPREFMGPIFQMNVKNAIQLVLANPDGATLLDVPLCFIGPRSFREKLLERVTNPLVKNFWTRTYEQTTDFHKSECLQYTISKFTPLLENEIMRNIVGQTSCLDLHRVLREKQILLCSLNKGIIGEQHAALLGTILMQKLEEATYARAENPPERREDAFVYLDEVHNLAGENLARFVSEARKFAVCLTFATQVLEQLDAKMRHATLGNAATLVCFRLGTPDAAAMAEYFRPGLDPSMLTRLPNYTAAVRVLAANRPRYAVVETLAPVPPASAGVTEELREHSRARNGRPRLTVEEEIFERIRRETGIEDREKPGSR